MKKLQHDNVRLSKTILTESRYPDLPVRAPKRKLMRGPSPGCFVLRGPCVTLFSAGFSISPYIDIPSNLQIEIFHPSNFCWPNEFFALIIFCMVQNFKNLYGLPRQRLTLPIIVKSFHAPGQ